MITKEYDYYKILGVHSTASLERIKEAFAEIRATIPAAQQNPESNPAFRRLLTAYEVLTDPDRRATYDTILTETAPDPLDIVIHASSEKIKVMDSAQILYLLVHIRPPVEEIKTQFPLNLALVIDRSTSMQGERLERVKTAVNLIIKQLSPDDIISVVSFSDRAEVVLPAGSVSDNPALLAQIRDIRASGGTEIYQGLIAGVQEMRRVNLYRHVNHLILLTDGHTYGDADKCLQLAQETAAQGIGMSAFGLGNEWNDQFLDHLVAPSGGQSGYIESPNQVLEYLQTRIKGLGHLYAQNLRFIPEFPRSVSLQHAFKLAPFAQPLTVGAHEIKLGNIEGRAPLNFLLELNIAPQVAENRITLPLHFMAHLPSQQMRERTFKHAFQIQILNDPPPVEPPSNLLKAVRLLNMYRMNEKVWKDVESGQMDAAALRMRRLSTRLMEAGETQLAQQAEAETQRLVTMGTISLEGRKRLKYGTRAMISQTMRLELEKDDQV